MIFHIYTILFAAFPMFKNFSKLSESRIKILSLRGGSVIDPTFLSQKSSIWQGNTDAEVKSDGQAQPYQVSDFIVKSRKIVYDGWRKVAQKEIMMPNQRISKFDVVTQGAPSVAVFIWDRASSTATLVQEYHPGVQRLMYGMVAGMYEGDKHATILDCAKDELEEEAHLSSDHWIPLLDSNNTAAPFEKYSDNELYPFLALDCRPVLNPKPADAEEFITVHSNISHARLLDMISSGQMNIVSSYTALLGIRKLKELGIPLTGLNS